MNLGTETGSLVNHVQSRFKASLPTIGDGATLLGFSDRHPATVVEVYRKGKFDYVVVQSDNYERIDNNGMSESQEYRYSRDEDGSLYTFRLKGDSWEAVRLDSVTKRFRKTSGGLRIGVRERYYDFSF